MKSFRVITFVRMEYVSRFRKLDSLTPSSFFITSLPDGRDSLRNVWASSTTTLLIALEIFIAGIVWFVMDLLKVNLTAVG
jgi:hypothetical protein